jgi:hypothetical protein
VGYYSDRCTSKMGRRRPFILAGCIIICLSVSKRTFPLRFLLCSLPLPVLYFDYSTDFLGVLRKKKLTAGGPGPARCW